MGTYYTSTLNIRCWKQHACLSCGGIYSYEFIRKIKGQAGNPAAATAKAQKLAAKALTHQVDIHPCPTCGLIQPDMVGQRRARIFIWTFWIALAMFAVLLIMRASHGIQSDAGTWAIAAISGVTALVLIFTQLQNPNANTANNIEIAKGSVTVGKLRDQQPGQSSTVSQELTRPGRSLAQNIFLLLLLVSVPIAAFPELLRSSRGWPLNQECYPPVVGPGDSTRVYMNQKIHSIKNYWRGRPQVFLQSDDGAPKQIPASTNDNNWGSSISAKSSETDSTSNPWVKITLPDEPSLEGKQVQTNIGLALQYPQKAGTSSFETVQTTMQRAVAIQLAKQSKAGETYDAWWWEGAGVAIAMIVLSALSLFSGAKGLQRTANPTRTYND